MVPIQGSAMGYSGKVNITLTIKDGKITEVTNTNSVPEAFSIRHGDPYSLKYWKSRVQKELTL